MSVELDPRHVIVRPLVTEKSLKTSERRNAWSFEVDPRANKVQIRRAVEALFHVKVLGVHTDLRHGKARRMGARVAFTADWKRAIVTLAEGQTLDVY